MAVTRSEGSLHWNSSCPQETLVEKHNFNRLGQTSGVTTHPRNGTGAWRKKKKIWIKGHTAALNPSAATGINTSDMMDFFSDGFYKSSVHRVVQPPGDHSAWDRLGSVYFRIVDDDVKLLPFAHSPVLQRVGIGRRYPDDEVLLSAVWRKRGPTPHGRSELKQGFERDVEEEVIEDVVVSPRSLTYHKL
ncbi:hypothetical protein BU15DRAFT_63289 [Melanogaster broomeanus]|nr:hypothetical protein BU15DRAFT_63289 [Melanogaster broomeanus]